MANRRNPRRRSTWADSRKPRLETLERRELLAAEVIAVRPDAGGLLDSGDTLNTPPREFNVLFKGGSNLDESTINSNSVKLVRSGGDGTFTDGNEVEVTLGYVGLAEPGNTDPENLQRIVMRPASSAALNSKDAAFAFPDDHYQIQIFGSGNNPLEDRNGDAFNNGTDFVTAFRLDRGAQVVAVVPQPIQRDAGGAISQASNEIVVYFDDQPLNQSEAEDPKFYRLVNTNGTDDPSDDSTMLPETVTYDSVGNQAVLSFASDIPEGTYRIDVGQALSEDGVRAGAVRIGTLLSGDGYKNNGYVGDASGSSTDASDVDLYQVEVRENAAITVEVESHSSALQTEVSILDVSGTVVTSVMAATPGMTVNLTSAALAVGTYFVEVKSVGGTSTGSYGLSVTVNGTPVSNSDFNSWRGDATDLGVLGAAEVNLSASIQRQFHVRIPFFPGGSDEPGHRQFVENDEHVRSNSEGTSLVTPPALVTRYYWFPDVLGQDPLGNDFPNLITESEKQIVRDVYEIFAKFSGFEFIESPSGSSPGGGITQVGKGDPRAAVDSDDPTGGTSWGSAGQVLMNGNVWDNSNRFFGDSFTTVLIHEIGHSLGLPHAYGIDATMGQRDRLGDVYLGDNDIVHLQRQTPPSSTDIDLYKFEVDERGTVQIETIAERLNSPSLLNSVVQLYREVPETGKLELVAQNDQYFGADAFLSLTVDPGMYFVGVTSTGNTQYDPEVPDSGYGGTTDGQYELSITFEASDLTGSLRDTDGTTLDGDADGEPGGVHSFWFQSSDPSTAIYVDKLNDSPVTPANGSMSNPFSSIADALQASGSRIVVPVGGQDSIMTGESFVVDDGVRQVTFTFNGGTHPINIGAAANESDVVDAIEAAVNTAVGAGDLVGVSVATNGRVVQLSGVNGLDTDGAATLLKTPNLVHIVGNGGNDNDVSTIGDNRPYLVGLDESGFPLEDGAEFLVPQGVTVMVHAGSLLKLRKANLDAGTSGAELSRSHSAIQVLGTPESSVFLRSYHDDAAGGNSDGLGNTPGGGDFGGIVLRDDSDLEDHGIFLNYINHADIKHGGGKVFVESRESVYAPVHLIDARPTVSFNLIADSSDAALSASPNSFAEQYYESGVQRIGPEIQGNFISRNTIDGLFIRVETPLGGSIDKLTASARFDDTDVTHILTENLIIEGGAGGPVLNGTLTARIAGRLVVDPGTVIKLSDARIEAERGAGSLIAEGTVDRPVIFTSINDDRYGGSGAFDSNSTPSSTPTPGDWGGLYFGHMTSGSLDHSIIAYGGGLTPIEGGDAKFGAIEIHQAWVRISNSLIQSNDNGADSSQRNGRGVNRGAAIYVRGAQPIIVDNRIIDNSGDAIEINANSLKFEVLRDPGRSTGVAEQYRQFDDNHGALIRLNRLEDNGTNGLSILGGTLTTEGIWDDTDITHVLRSEIRLDNFHTNSGLTLQSSNSESLVIKLDGGNAGFTATGTPLDIHDRIGGTLYVLGTVGHPVVLTHLNDDTVGAGYTPSGEVMYNTNNSNNPSSGVSGGWRGLRFDEFSNDRNVAVIRELENPLTTGKDSNFTPAVSQLLGTLAPDQKSGDENRRLGFEVNGFISPDDSSDVDVYSFTATPGTGVWIDVDRTDTTLDAVIEVVNSVGTVLARSVRPGFAGSENEFPSEFNERNLTQDPVLLGDHYTQNFRDPGLFYVLPGAGDLGTYFVRVSSLNGESRGEYSMQVRLDQVQEHPGSTVRYADIRYATNGIDVRGLPAHSPLAGEAGELANGTNNVSDGAEVLVNLLQTDQAALSIAGSLSDYGDIDWYQFEVTQRLADNGRNSTRDNTIGVVFDLDYSDGAVRADTTIAVYDAGFNLIYLGRDSDIQDDQTATDDLSGGSLGVKDAYIGPIHLNASDVTNYFVAVMSGGSLPTAVNGVFSASADGQVRLEPVNSVERVIEDHIGSQGYVSVTPKLPTDGSLFDVDNNAELGTHVTPLTLGDVALYVTTDTLRTANNDLDGLYTVDPFAGGQSTLVAGDDADADSPYTRNSIDDIQDIVMRSDGTLWGYRRVANDITQVGNLVQINPDDGSIISTQSDGIPSSAIPNVTLGDFSEIATTDWVDALAWQRNDTSDYDLYYAVRENSTDNFDVLTETWGTGPTENSKLYRADPDNGSAAEVDNEPWGEKGDIQPAGVSFASKTIIFSDGNGDSARVDIESKVPGVNGQFTLNIFENNTGTNDVTVSEANRTITIRIDQDPNPTAGGFASLINSDADARKYVTANVRSANNLAGTGEAETTDGALALQSGLSSFASDGFVNAANGLVGPLNGRVTGLAFGSFSGTQLFGVTNAGEFIVIDKSDGDVTKRVDFDITAFGALDFEGLALGPQNVEGGAYQNTLFAITRGGDLFAIDVAAVTAATDLSDPAQVSGVLRQIFDSNGDGAADAFSVNVGESNAVGLAFSPLDFNLWHTTNKRGGDTGHGINESPDETREAVDGETSFYFGLENWDQQANDNNSYIINGGNAQFGILNPEFHEDLTSNPLIGENYNLPAGGYGSLTTNSFSLAGNNYHDRPTLYFNYFLDTEGHAGSDETTDVDDPFRDSARVFIRSNGGAWELLTTNNSELTADRNDDRTTAELPTFLSQFSDAGLNSATPEDEHRQVRQELHDNQGEWRQTRVDLSQYAGSGNLELRFDFSTAGALKPGTLGGDPDDINGEFGELTHNDRSIRSTDNNHEGFYIDDIIIGFAERGEMVTGTSGDSTVTTVAEDPAGFNLPPDGPYQLEIRRTEDAYIQASPDGTPHPYQVATTFDTDARHVYQDNAIVPGSTEIDADRNRERAQGVFILESNFISDSSQFGINVQPGASEAGGNLPHPGSAIQFPQLNSGNLVPGIVIQNNVITDSDGIRLAGETTTNPNRPTPLARIVNNTLVGENETGTGIAVSGNVSPTIINNLLTDLDVGISNSGIGTVIRSNFFQDNRSNGAVGTAQIISPDGSPLFVDPSRDIYVPEVSSEAVDSSQNVEQDRFNYVNFKREIGIPASPTFAPDRDIYGQLRTDSNASPGGGGSNVFKDRGAADVADFDDPFALLQNPVDNDSLGVDRDPTPTMVFYSQELLGNFTILLGDGPGPNSPFEGTGVDGLTVDDPTDATISQRAVIIEENGVPLQEGVDYNLSYNALTGVLLLTPLSTLWNTASVYEVFLDNSQITDKVGNRLRANQLDGSTQFTIIMPDVENDFGDAGETFATRLRDNGPRHAIVNEGSPRLGAEVDGEFEHFANIDAFNLPLAPDVDDVLGVDDEDGISLGTYDDGGIDRLVFTRPGTDPANVVPDDVLGFLNPEDASGALISVDVVGSGFLQAWVDFDQSGTFDTDEQVLTNVALDDSNGGNHTLNVVTPSDAVDGLTWMRLRFSGEQDISPNGFVIGGEVEDHRVEVISVALPMPNDDAYSVLEDESLDTLAAGLPSVAGTPGSPGYDPPPAGIFIPLEYIVTSNPVNGSLSLDVDTGHFVYTPIADFQGVDTFTYRVITQESGRDNPASSNSATVFITVNPDNDAPGVNGLVPLMSQEDEALIVPSSVLLAGATGDESPDYVNPVVGPLEARNEAFLNEENQLLSISALQGNGGTPITAANAADGGNVVVTRTSTGLSLVVTDTASDLFTLGFGGTTVTFELVPFDGTPQPDTVPIRVFDGDDADDLADQLEEAIEDAFDSTTPGISTSVSGNAITVDVDPIALGGSEVGSSFDVLTGAGVLDVDVSGGPAAGDTVTVNVGGSSVTFELVNEGDSASGSNLAVVLLPFADPNSDAARASAAAQLALAMNQAFADAGQGAYARIEDGAANPFRVHISAASIAAGKAFTTDRGSVVPMFDDSGALTELRYINTLDLNRDNHPSSLPNLDAFTFVVSDDGIAINLVDNVFEYLGPLTSDPVVAELEVKPQNDAPELTADVVSIGPLGPDAANVDTDWEVFGGATPTEDTALVIDSAFLLQNDFRGRSSAADESEGGLDGQGLNDRGLLVTEVSMVNPQQGTVELRVDGTILFTPADDIFGDIVFNYAAQDLGINEAFDGTQTVSPITTRGGVVTVVVQPDNDEPVAFDRMLTFGESDQDQPDVFEFDKNDLLNGNAGLGETPGIPHANEASLPVPFNESEQTLRVVGFRNGTDQVDVPATGTGTLTLATDVSGGLYEFDYENGEFTTGRLITSSNYNSAFGLTEDFTYVISDDGFTDTEAAGSQLASQGYGNFFIEEKTSAPATVSIEVTPGNDAPIFDIPNGTIDVLEDTPGTWVIPDFVTNILPGPNPSAQDELDLQNVTFTVEAISAVPSDLMSVTPIPTVTPDGTLEVHPNVDQVGQVTYRLIATDGLKDPTDPNNPSNFVPRTTVQEFTVNVRPVNDAPRFDPLADTFADSDGPDESYVVGPVANGEAPIRYTLREDNTDPSGNPQPYFIPLNATNNPGYNRIGLLDVFNVGPQNEIDDSDFGGNPPFDIASFQALRLLGFDDPMTELVTARGGTLTPHFDGGVLTGLDYQPPLDFNSVLGGVDSFVYTVSDDRPNGGETFDLNSSSLVEDQLTASNRVELFLNPVNDRPVFTLTSDDVSVLEDSREISFDGFAVNIFGGPLLTAIDETSQALGFTVDLKEYSSFYDSVLGGPATVSDLFEIAPSIDPDSGVLNFKPAADVFGTFEFDVILMDDGLGEDDNDRGDLNASIPVSLTINVQPVNDAPSEVDPPVDLSYTIKEDGTFEIPRATLLSPFVAGPANELVDTAPEPGGSQTIDLAPTEFPSASAGGGVVRYIDDGGDISLSYTPRADFVGTDTFVYTVIDDGVSAKVDGSVFSEPRITTKTVTVEVTPVNDLPRFSGGGNVQTSENAGIVTIQNWATNVLVGPITAEDEIATQSLIFLIDEQSSTADLFATPPVATVDPLTNTATLSFELNPDASGEATFRAILEDDGPMSVANGDQWQSDPPRMFTISVAGINNPPSFELARQIIALPEDNGPYTGVDVINISPGPADEASQTVTFDIEPLSATDAALFASQPTISSEGVLQFTTAANKNTDNANGPVVLVISARDSEGGVSGSQELTISISEVNDPPLAVMDELGQSDEDTILTLPETTFLANDEDPDLESNANEVLSIVMPEPVLSRNGATVSLDPATREITYDPTSSSTLQALRPGQQVVDSFEYTVRDVAGDESTTTVEVIVNGVNDAPTVREDFQTVNPTGSTTVDVLSNDNDIDGFIATNTVEIGSQPSFGTVAVTASGQLIYTPFVSNLGEDVFTYTVADNLGARSEQARVTVSSNSRPTAGNDAARTYLNESVTIDVAKNDSDPDGEIDLDSIEIVTNPRNGQAIPQGDGTVVYLPAVGFVGGDSFEYRILDDDGIASNVARVDVEVLASRLMNPDNNADVNDDGFVTALDALLIINRLDRSDSGEIPVLPSDVGPDYYDVNGNLTISANDALVVINTLSETTGGSGEEIAPISEENESVEETLFAPVADSFSNADKIVGLTSSDPVSSDIVDLLAADQDKGDDDSAVDAIDSAMADVL